VRIEPLFEGRAWPLLVTPRQPGLVLSTWAAGVRAELEELARGTPSLLFRGFELDGPADFERFVKATTDSECLPYLDRSTPRETHGRNVYCTTVHPPAYPIRLHNEGSYWKVHPERAYFACLVAPPVGGETPVGDVHAVWRRIDPGLREEFARRGWCLVRNFNDGLGLPWQEVFQTTDRGEVERYAAANGIGVEWRPGGGLRTRQVRPAILLHPRTGEPLWHNHAAFFHVHTQAEPIRAALLAAYAREELPYHTTFGDGGEIPDATIDHLNAAYDAELFKFRWEPGDVHWIDNLRLAHAREPYEGERLILVALTDAWRPDAGERAAG